MTTASISLYEKLLFIDRGRSALPRHCCSPICGIRPMNSPENHAKASILDLSLRPLGETWPTASPGNLYYHDFWFWGSGANKNNFWKSDGIQVLEIKIRIFLILYPTWMFNLNFLGFRPCFWFLGVEPKTLAFQNIMV